ncbi:hypothetical protein HanPI659440_Chr00c08g0719621 [Helianthus annuus]|nr:hypothetical protein HanPI659440_Chr00c08g0719621 [Helianthus annuus]
MREWGLYICVVTTRIPRASNVLFRDLRVQLGALVINPSAHTHINLRPNNGLEDGPAILSPYLLVT